MAFAHQRNLPQGSNFFGSSNTTTAVGRPNTHSAWNATPLENFAKGEAQTTNARAIALLNSSSSKICKAASETNTTVSSNKSKVLRQMKLSGGRIVRPDDIVVTTKKGKKTPSEKNNRSKSVKTPADGGRFNSAFTTMSDDEELNGENIGSSDTSSDEEDDELSDDFCDDRDEDELTQESSDEEISERRHKRREFSIAEQQIEIFTDEEQQNGYSTNEESDEEWVIAAKKSKQEEREVLEKLLKEEREGKEENSIPLPPARVNLSEMPVLLEAFFCLVDDPTDRSLAGKMQKNAITILENNFIPFDDQDQMRKQFSMDFAASTTNSKAVKELEQFTRWHSVYSRLAKISFTINRTRRRMSDDEIAKIDQKNVRRYEAIMKERMSSSSSSDQEKYVDLTTEKPRWIETRPKKVDNIIVVFSEEDELEQTMLDEEPIEELEKELEQMHLSILFYFGNHHLFSENKQPWSLFYDEFFSLLSCAEDNDFIGFLDGDHDTIATNGKGTNGHPLIKISESPNPGKLVRIPKDLNPLVFQLVVRVLRLRDAAIRAHQKSSLSVPKVMFLDDKFKKIRVETIIVCPTWMETLLQRTGVFEERDLQNPTVDQVVRAIRALGRLDA